MCSSGTAGSCRSASRIASYAKPQSWSSLNSTSFEHPSARLRSIHARQVSSNCFTARHSRLESFAMRPEGHGRRSRDELLSALRDVNVRAEAARCDAEPEARASLLEASLARALASPIKLVLGIDDHVYFHWQLAVFFESLVAQLPPGCEPMVVVCNGHGPLSPALERIFAVYGVRHFTGANHPRAVNIDFASGGEAYSPFNKIEALNVVSTRLAAHDRVCLLDADNFLFGDFDPQVFPVGDAVCESWLLDEETAHARRELDAVRLPKLLEAIGLPGELPRGGVAIFLRAQTLADPKFVRDCFRFSQVIYLLGRIAGRELMWLAETPSYALAFAANRVDAETLPAEHFVIDQRAELTPGSFYHYYHDIEDGGGCGAFHASPWGKQAYRREDLLAADLEAFEAAAATAHERAFFALAIRARERLGG